MSVLKKCYECDTYIQNDSMDDSDLVDGCNVVKYPAKKISEAGEMVREDPEVWVYLCDDCYEENRDDVIETVENNE